VNQPVLAFLKTGNYLDVLVIIDLDKSPADGTIGTVQRERLSKAEKILVVRP
jgi:hypothetical protein